MGCVQDRIGSVGSVVSMVWCQMATSVVCGYSLHARRTYCRTFDGETFSSSYGPREHTTITVGERSTAGHPRDSIILEFGVCSIVQYEARAIVTGVSPGGYEIEHRRSGVHRVWREAQSRCNVGVAKSTSVVETLHSAL